MTTIVAWAGVDQRKVSSIYIASDSRITWGDSALGTKDVRHSRLQERRTSSDIGEACCSRRSHYRPSWTNLP